jgi:hypothetical protein
MIWVDWWRRLYGRWDEGGNRLSDCRGGLADVVFEGRQERRLALRTKPSRCEGPSQRLRSFSAASRPIPLRHEIRTDELPAASGGPFDSAPIWYRAPPEGFVAALRSG